MTETYRSGRGAGAPAGLHRTLIALAVCLVATGCATRQPPLSTLSDAATIDVEYSSVWDDVRSGEHSVGIAVDSSAGDVTSAVWKQCFPNREGILHGHIAPAVSVGAKVGLGQEIGGGLAKPAARSSRFEKELAAADGLYGAGNYDASVAELAGAYAAEGNNPFVIETYARALYRTDRRASALVPYQRLVSSLDTVGDAAAPGYLYIDHWFIDAYWKLATLYLDAGEYEPAICEIGRVMLVLQQDAMLKQALEYLTEANAMSGKPDLARYYASEALRRFGDDSFAKQFLATAAADPAAKRTD